MALTLTWSKQKTQESGLNQERTITTTTTTRTLEGMCVNSRHHPTSYSAACRLASEWKITYARTIKIKSWDIKHKHHITAQNLFFLYATKEVIGNVCCLSNWVYSFWIYEYVTINQNRGDNKITKQNSERFEFICIQKNLFCDKKSCPPFASGIIPWCEWWCVIMIIACNL